MTTVPYLTETLEIMFLICSETTFFTTGMAFNSLGHIMMVEEDYGTGGLWENYSEVGPITCSCFPEPDYLLRNFLSSETLPVPTTLEIPEHNT